jgi:hypothetical protein
MLQYRSFYGPIEWYSLGQESYQRLVMFLSNFLYRFCFSWQSPWSVPITFSLVIRTFQIVGRTPRSEVSFDANIKRTILTEQITRVEGKNPSTVVARVVRDDVKGTQCPRDHWATLFLGDINMWTWLHVGRISDERIKYGREFCGTWTREWLLWQGPEAIV